MANERVVDLLHERLGQCMIADAGRLRRRLKELRARLDRGEDVSAQCASIAQAIDASAGRITGRRALVPRIEYPPDLPVAQRRDEIARLIESHQVIVVTGETGSGKTTQLPKICLELGRGIRGLIGHTQPRKVAARSIAARIAAELNTPLGNVVGYKVRFDQQEKQDVLVRIMTDGILLAQTQSDPFLLQYDTIILDEAHERSLNIDFLLGYLKQLLPRRPDLKVIITSATIDPQRFSTHFDDAPMIQISGRTHPVQLRYRPLEGVDQDDRDAVQIQGILAALAELQSEPAGDVLVFLATEREIHQTAKALKKSAFDRYEVLPLMARLTSAEQSLIFKAHTRPRIVLATNVAETSVTVPQIRYVIDAGTARISHYLSRTKVQGLPIEPISQASADQRMGRCGRIGEGICIRLYSQEDFQTRPLFTSPEITRTSLASIILQMKSLRLGNIDQFPFVEPPDYRMIRDGYQTLHELGAIDEDNQLTPRGRDLARLPIDPRLGTMILAGVHEGVADQVLVIAAALSLQDPRLRPHDQQTQADQLHARFADPQSDFVTYLNLWRLYTERKSRLSSGRLRRWCHDNFLSYVRMRQWWQLYHQLRQMLSRLQSLRGRHRHQRTRNRPRTPTQFTPHHE